MEKVTVKRRDMKHSSLDFSMGRIYLWAFITLSI